MASETLFLLAFLAVFGISGGYVGPLEICERETFQANCDANEVISITSAEYGRMSLGQCLSKDYGLLGCAVDVTKVLEWLCSGRRKCSVTGSHSALVDAKTQACDKDLAAYLVVSYRCLKVATGSRRSCTSKGYNLLPITSGLISTNQATESGFGSGSCPWRLQPTSGEQYNVTMTTFGASDGAVECRKVVEVREGSESKDVVLCGSDARAKNVYITQGGSSVDLVVMTEALGPNRRVLLQYEALECEDPTLPSQAYFSRRSSTEAQITCKESGDAWVVECIEGKWTGEVGSCAGEKIFEAENQNPYAFFIVVIVGTVIGMLIGGALLFLLIFSFRKCRRKYRRKRHRPPSFRFDDYLTYNGHLQKNALWNDIPTRTPHNWLDLGHATLPSDVTSPSRTEYTSLPRDVTLRRSSYASLPREPPIDPRAPPSERLSMASRDGSQRQSMTSRELLPDFPEHEEIHEHLSDDNNETVTGKR